MVDFVGRAKWNAWSELGQMSQVKIRFISNNKKKSISYLIDLLFLKTDAERAYIKLVEELAQNEKK